MGAVEEKLAGEAPDDALWTVADAARYLRVSKGWVYQASADGRMPCVRIGALVRFEPAAIKAWAAGGGRGGKVVHLPGRRG